MTEFFQPTTHVRADWEWVSYVHRTYHIQSNHRRTFRPNHYVDSVTTILEAFRQIFIAQFMNVCELIFSEGRTSLFQNWAYHRETISKSENPEREV